MYCGIVPAQRELHISIKTKSKNFVSRDPTNFIMLINLKVTMS